MTRRDRADDRRAGFTIVELLVAIVVMTVGILALAASAAVVTRFTRVSTQQTVVATAAQSRMERLRATNCASITAGVDTVRKVYMTWAVRTIPRGRVVTLSAAYDGPRGRRTKVFMEVVPC